MKKVLLVISLLLSINLSAFGRNLLVLEIDTGVAIHKDFKDHLIITPETKENYVDNEIHGTHVAGLILKNTCPEVKLLSCSYYISPFPIIRLEAYINCLKSAIILKPDVINISSSGKDFIKEEYNIIMELNKLNIKIVTAAGNEGRDISIIPAYPASYKFPNIIPVGSLNRYGIRANSSNYGLPNEVWEVGEHVVSTLPGDQYGTLSGTSMATAVRTNRILRGLCGAK